MGMNPTVAMEHSRIEHTVLAKMLERGTVSHGVYANYLRSSLAVWLALEDYFPLAKDLNVSARLLDDLIKHTDGLLEVEKTSPCARVHADRVREADLRVLGLGLCYGGKVMAKHISERAGFPVSHFHMPDDSIARLRAIDAPQDEIITAFARTTEWYRDAV